MKKVVAAGPWPNVASASVARSCSLRDPRTRQTSRSESMHCKSIFATYRSTPHSLAGCTPAKLFLGRELRTQLSCLRPNLNDSATADSGKIDECSKNGQLFGPESCSRSHFAGNSADTAMRNRVRFQQQRVKNYTDAKRHAKQPEICVGDFVRIKRPSLKHKLDTIWSEPLRVIATHGSSVQLENGQRWNASSCLLHRASIKNNSPNIQIEHSVRTPELSAPESLTSESHTCKG